VPRSPQYCLLFFICSLSQPLYADLVFLKNGDRITGKVSSMLKNELKLTTPYSELTIPWHDIKNKQALLKSEWVNYNLLSL